MKTNGDYNMGIEIAVIDKPSFMDLYHLDGKDLFPIKTIKKSEGIYYNGRLHGYTTMGRYALLEKMNNSLSDYFGKDSISAVSGDDVTFKYFASLNAEKPLHEMKLSKLRYLLS
jgi:hypothetical protein